MSGSLQSRSIRSNLLHKSLAILALSGALVLGACAGLPGVSVVTTPAGQGTVSADPTVNAVQDAAAKICGFVPTVNTVVGIITQFTGGAPVAGIVGDVAGAICSAINPKKTLRGRLAGPPNVQGVPVQGYYVK